MLSKTSNPAQQLVKDIKSLNKNSDYLETLMPQIKQLTSSLISVQELVDQGFHLQCESLYENYPTAQQQLLDIIIHISDICVQQNNYMILLKFGVDGRFIDTFNRFLASNLCPYIDTQNYINVSKLSPMSMDKLVLLEAWVRLQINFIMNQELVQYMETNSGDIVNLILLCIDQGETVLEGIKQQELKSAQILMLSIKSMMLQYTSLLSQFEWVKIRICSNKQFFDGIFTTLINEITSAKSLIHFYKLLSNLLQSPFFPIDKEEKFITRVLIDFTYELITSIDSLQILNRRQQLIRSVLKSDNTDIDDALCRCYFEFSEIVKLRELLSSELNTYQIDILPYIYQNYPQSFLLAHHQQRFWLCCLISQYGHEQFITGQLIIEHSIIDVQSKSMIRNIAYSLQKFIEQKQQFVMQDPKLLKYFSVNMEKISQLTKYLIPQNQNNLIANVQLTKPNVQLTQHNQKKQQIDDSDQQNLDKTQNQNDYSSINETGKGQILKDINLSEVKLKYKPHHDNNDIDLTLNQTGNSADKTNNLSYFNKYWYFQNTPKSQVPTIKQDDSVISKFSPQQILPNQIDQTFTVPQDNSKKDEIIRIEKQYKFCQFCSILYKRNYRSLEGKLEKKSTHINKQEQFDIQFLTKIHSLYHSYLVISNIFEQSVNQLSSEVLIKLLDILIMTIILTSDMNKKMKTKNLFLLNTKCQSESQIIMRQVLKINIKSMETIIKSHKGDQSLFNDALMIKLVRIISYLSSIKNINMLIQVLNDVYCKKVIQTEEFEVFCNLLRQIEKSNKNIKIEFNEILMQNKITCTKFQIFQEQIVYGQLLCYLNSITLLNNFFTSVLFKPKNQIFIDELLQNEYQVKTFLESFMPMIDILQTISHKFRQEGLQQESDFQGMVIDYQYYQIQTRNIFNAIGETKRRFVLLLNCVSSIVSRQDEVIQSGVYQMILRDTQDFTNDDQTKFLLFESFYNSCKYQRQLEQIGRFYPTFDKDLVSLFNKIQPNFVLLPLIRALKLILEKRPKDNILFQSIVQQLEQCIIGAEKYDKNQVEEFRLEMEKLDISKIQPYIMIQQSNQPQFEDQTFLSQTLNLNQQKDASIPIIPYNQITQKNQQLYIDKLFEQEGKNLLKLLILIEIPKEIINEKQLQYLANRRRYVPQAGAVSDLMLDVVTREHIRGEIKTIQHINKDRQFIQQKIDQTSRPIPIDPIQAFLQPGFQLIAPSQQMKSNLRLYKIPDYYQLSTQQMFDKMNAQDLTVEIEQVVHQEYTLDLKQQQRFFHSYLISIEDKSNQRGFLKQTNLILKIVNLRQPSRQSKALSNAGEKSLIKNHYMNPSLSQMPQQDSEKLLFMDNNLSKIKFNGDYTKSSINKDLNMFKPYNLEFEINQAYKSMINK